MVLDAEARRDIRIILGEEEEFQRLQAELDASRAELDASMVELNAKNAEIKRLREMLMKYEIVSRYYYQKGRIIATLDDDPELKMAVKIILNQEEYNNILTGTK